MSQTHDDSSPAMIRTDLRGGILLAVLDMPGRTMNVFSWELMNQLEALIGRVERDDGIQAVVLTSGKPSFLAGADLDMVRGFTEMGRTASRADLHERCGRLGRLFVRLESLAKPWVAAVNGLALGGGLELAMACRYRLAADDPRIQLGLPEIRLGLLPGAGGTQRLPRLVGFEKGMELLLSGKPVSPAEAKALGLMDELVPANRLIDRAVEVARKLAGKPGGSRLPPRLDTGDFDPAAPDVVRRVTRRYGHPDAVTEAYPAYDAIVRATLEGAGKPMRDGGEIEMERFVDLMQNEVAGNMVTVLFLDRQKADKLLLQAPKPDGVRFAVTGEGAGAQRLRAMLAVAKVAEVDAAQAGETDVVIAPAGDAMAKRADLRLLDSADDRIGGTAGIHVRRSAHHGTVVEIVTAGGEEPGKALALARQLRATPYLHAGSRSLLAALADVERRAAEAGLPEAAILAAQALAAGTLDAEGGIGDRAMADVACAVAGVFPAHAGGPFLHLARHGADALAAQAAGVPALPG
ncbi:enoyl-CoA hydratase-related protein [Azospirillum agricola]|uniref:enoyl-CoA hydratase-related protein n=1 Tax=Azospirillum agricola TaxID=1720247 RepID=UPI000A0F315C|nr:enoyl-CoA hydratase-related protein [Azospirillum agricola]SMH38859.1 3-hydroxyacyl-CoA dehydrogenase / enoyl-CoA hydratase / 3-hydroxybutyryl-CoA epimerase [Azospirillum lipoferum]